MSSQQRREKHRADHSRILTASPPACDHEPLRRKEFASLRNLPEQRLRFERVFRVLRVASSLQQRRVSTLEA
jgi:hypothetical protein